MKTSRKYRGSERESESNANEQQQRKIFPFYSFPHFRILPSNFFFFALLYANLLKLTFLRAITIAIMCLRLCSRGQGRGAWGTCELGLMRLCFFECRVASGRVLSPVVCVTERERERERERELGLSVY